MLALAGLRVFVLPLHESPKWLLAMGRDEAAVRVIHDVARTNGVTSSLTLETLQAAAARYNIDGSDLGDTATHFTMWQLIKMSTSNMRGEHIRALFRGKRLAWNTSLIIFICECASFVVQYRAAALQSRPQSSPVAFCSLPRSAFSFELTSSNSQTELWG